MVRFHESDSQCMNDKYAVPGSLLVICVRPFVWGVLGVPWRSTRVTM